MTNYLQQQTVADLLRNTVAIYRKSFRIILLSCILPNLPFLIWQVETQAAQATGWYVVAYVCSFIVSTLAFGVILLAIADICLGNRPSVRRAARKLYGKLALKLLLACALVTAVIYSAFWLYVVPGLFAWPWLLFVTTVVMLEDESIVGAVKRSFQLARGFNLRNLSVVLMLFMLLFVGLVLLLLPFAMAAGHSEGFPFRALMVAFITFGVPLLYIATVLMYYDIRVRKEAYDAAALTEDLRR